MGQSDEAGQNSTTNPKPGPGGSADEHGRRVSKLSKITLVANSNASV